MRKPDPPPSTSKRASMSTVEKSRSSLDQLPTSSSSNSTTSGSADDAPPPPPAPTPVSTVGIKRKKSRSHCIPDEDEESDGAQADAEYGGLRAAWANVEGRRKSAQGSRTVGRYEGDDGRRHSIAI